MSNSLKYENSLRYAYSIIYPHNNRYDNVVTKYAYASAYDEMGVIFCTEVSKIPPIEFINERMKVVESGVEVRFEGVVSDFLYRIPPLSSVDSIVRPAEWEITILAIDKETNQENYIILNADETRLLAEVLAEHVA